MTPGDSASAIVVGAGVWGAAIADELVTRGWSVTLVEEWAPANARGSSGDRTRMVRAGYASDEEVADLWYARSARASLARWAEIEIEEDIKLLYPTPLVWFATDQAGVEQTVIGRLRAVGLEPEVISPDRLTELFPSVAVQDLAFAVLEPEAAIIRATDAVETFVHRALRGGATLLLEHAEPVEQPGAVSVGGRILTADRVVWACGSWLGRLFPEEAPITATWQDVIHWHAPARWRSSAAWFDEQQRLYGFPDVEGLGIKAVTHRPGKPIDLDRTPRVLDRATIASVAQYLARRFPELAAAPLLWGRVMHYEMTADGHFMIGVRPGDDRSLIAGGGSGHGFKHAPSIARHVADLIEGRAEPLAMFALGPRVPKAVWR